MTARDAIGYVATAGGLVLLLLAGLVNHESTSDALGPTLKLIFTPVVIFGGLASAFIGYRLL